MKEIKRIEEKRGKDAIIITIYKSSMGGFTYSLQASLGPIVKAIFPHKVEEVYPSQAAAKVAAIDRLASWTSSSRAAKRRAEMFDIAKSPSQLEFDFG